MTIFTPIKYFSLFLRFFQVIYRKNPKVLKRMVFDGKIANFLDFNCNFLRIFIMRILHTSDWHIGKKLETKSRLSEQAKVLSDISRIVKEYKVDIVLVAGDIYDTYMPSAESEKLFYDVVSDITACGAQIIIISGNHDDPTRLSAAKAISSYGGVYFAGSGLNNAVSDFKGNFSTRLIDCRDDYFIFEKDDERVCFSAVPYPTELRMKEKVNDEESYAEKVARYISNSLENAADLPVVLISHLFMLGGTPTEGERPIDLGGARVLPPEIIPNNCIYTALGHLHKRQVVSHARNIIYSGSIMPYSFDEAGIEKSVTVFDVLDKKVKNLEVVKLSGYKNLYRIKAESFEEAEEKIVGLDGFTEVSLTLDKPMGDNIKGFILKHPDAFLKLTFKGVETAVSGRKTLNDADLFTEYFTSRYGKEPSKDILELYLEMLSDMGVEYEA